MTAEQCACRQAEHENLIRELVEALRIAQYDVTHLIRVEIINPALAKAKAQGYA